MQVPTRRDQRDMRICWHLHTGHIYAIAMVNRSFRYPHLQEAIDAGKISLEAERLKSAPSQFLDVFGLPWDMMQLMHTYARTAAPWISENKVCKMGNVHCFLISKNLQTSSTKIFTFVENLRPFSIFFLTKQSS